MEEEIILQYIKFLKNDVDNMGRELLPYMGRTDTPSAVVDDFGKGKASREASGENNVDESSDAVLGRPFGAMEERVQAFDLLGLRSVESPIDNLISENHDIRHFVPPEKGPKCATHLNPTPEFVLHSLLGKIKDPLVLHLRGCHQLFSPASSPFPFEKFKTLTCLEISGVIGLTSSTLLENTISKMTLLQSLKLSHLPIQRLPTDFLLKLTKLLSFTLKDCPNIQSLLEPPQILALEYLELSHLLIETLPTRFFSKLAKLQKVILRGCFKLSSLPDTQHMRTLRVLDLSHCTTLEMEPIIICNKVWKLDFSYTALHFTSKLLVMASTTHLFLRDLKVINFEGFSSDQLINLKVVDVSGAESVKGLDRLKGSKKLEALDLSRIGIEYIDFISDLVNLRYLILKECTSLQKLPTMEKLTRLEVLDISGCDLPDDISTLKTVPSLDTHDLAVAGPSTSGMANELYIVATYFGNSGFDRFSKNFEVIVGLISRFQENLAPVSSIEVEDSLPPTTPTEMIHGDRIQMIMRECRRMVADLKYIRDNIGRLESCPNRTSAEELLDELTDSRDVFPQSEYAFLSIDPSEFHFQLNLTNFNQVIRAVVKLKLLVPPKPVDVMGKNRKVKFKTRRVNGVERARRIDMDTLEMQALRCSFDSLTNIQKNCLMHFGVGFRFAVVYKEKFLIQLWYGEGFIDPQNAENVVHECTTSNDDTNQVEEIGRKVLMALEEKQFIKRIDPWDRESKSWILQKSAKDFLRARATPENLFVFQHETGKLATHFTDSHRACLLEFGRDDFPIDINSSSQTLDCYKTIRTLINLNAPNIYITPEWFSKMRNLSVLHLRGLNVNSDEGIEVVDLNFLEELKYMEKLRLLSLERFATMKKLPDSVCKVTTLRVLNLRDCSYLEELPSGIGSLINLTHLDLTDCPILCMLPKGIAMLSNLEALKGFVIYYHIGGRQHPTACTLRDLLKLEKLRKLNLVAHTEGFPFPNSIDLHVLNGMKNLCSLKIIWQLNRSHLGQQHRDVVEQKALRRESSSNRWRRLKYWEKPKPQIETEELLRGNLKKLELGCFPFETTPEWLHPIGLQNLEKLYFRGGNLITLVGDGNQDTWGVEALVFRYLPNLLMDWKVLRRNFPRITYLEVMKSRLLTNNPCNPRGVWTIEVDKWKREIEDNNWTREIEDEE